MRPLLLLAPLGWLLLADAKGDARPEGERAARREARGLGSGGLGWGWGVLGSGHWSYSWRLGVITSPLGAAVPTFV